MGTNNKMQTQTDRDEAPGIAPLTAQVARLARTAMIDTDGTECRWEWDEIVWACLVVAREAARMAHLSEEDWAAMMAQIRAEEATGIAAGGVRDPLNHDGSLITFDQRVERGEWVVQHEEPER